MKIVHFRGVERADPTSDQRRKTADIPLLKHYIVIVCSRDYFVSVKKVLIIICYIFRLAIPHSQSV